MQVDNRALVNRLERQDAVRLSPAPRTMYVTPQERGSYPGPRDYFPSQVRLSYKDEYHPNQLIKPVETPVKMQTHLNEEVRETGENTKVHPVFTVGGEGSQPPQKPVNQQQQSVPKTDHVDSTGASSKFTVLYHRDI